MPVRPPRFRGSRRQRMIVLLLTLLPACCAPPPKPAEPVPEAPPPAQPHAARLVLRATWTFQAGPDACIALAKAGSTSLQIAVRPEGLLRLAMSLPGDAPDRPVARFSGSAGYWQILGAHAGDREVTFSLARNETSLSRILMLLSGGMLSLEPPDENLPVLSLPESGAEGRKWFACARRSVN